jgi:hypothetical protein
MSKNCLALLIFILCGCSSTPAQALLYGLQAGAYSYAESTDDIAESSCLHHCSSRGHDLSGCVAYCQNHDAASAVLLPRASNH